MTLENQVWVLVEYVDGQLREISLEMLNKGRNLADKSQGELCLVVFGDDSTGLKDKLTSCGSDKAYLIDAQSLKGFTGEAYAEALLNLVREKTPEILLCSTTPFGQDIASRLAALLRIGIAANCISLELSDGGQLSAARSIFDGKIAETVIFPAARPQIATVRAGIGDTKPLKTNRKTEIIQVEPQLNLSRVCSRVTGFLKADPRTLSINEAELIVAGGGGVTDIEGFHLLEKLSELLGGCVAASRVLVDRGWVPFTRQVGQTGMTVSPKLYFAVGISGSVYHTMGMKDSRIIIAINKDRGAPIFKLADLSIVGDAKEVVGAIVEKLGGGSR